MRNILIHLSGLAGLLVFLYRLWQGASFEETLGAGVVVGLAVYLILFVADATVQHILNRPEAAEEAGEAAGSEALEQPDAPGMNQAPAPAGS